MHKTKIISTVGPASSTENILEKLIKAGVDVFRLNFSYGDHSFHLDAIKKIKAISNKLKKPIAVLQDLQGPKIRVGKFKNNEPVYLKKGNIIKIITKDILGSDSIISTTYKDLFRDVSIGDKILIDDGLIELKVIKKEDNDVVCKIIVGGYLREYKGINLPNVDVSANSLTKKDKRDLKFGLENGVDYVALSFVRKPQDILNLKRLMRKYGNPRPIIAKIEKPQAIDAIDEIINVSDGVMIARGDLGVEMSTEIVPILQKQIIAKANDAGKIVITATQMLESMINSPTPTRAEASDVANAIFDGTDVLMLSGETARGKYPVEAVKMMVRIAEESERSSFKIGHRERFDEDDDSPAKAIANSVWYASKEAKAKAIVVFTLSGSTALLIAKQRPEAEIIALTPLGDTYQKMSLYWGVRPLLSEFGENTDEMIRKGEETIIKNGFLKKGDKVVVVAGKTYSVGSTNMMKIYKLSESYN